MSVYQRGHVHTNNIYFLLIRSWYVLDGYTFGESVRPLDIAVELCNFIHCILHKNNVICSADVINNNYQADQVIHQRESILYSNGNLAARKGKSITF